MKLHLRKRLFPPTETWRKHAKKWYGSAVTAATETRVNVTKPTAQTRVNRRVCATVSHISSTFPFTDSWYFVLCCGPPSLKIRRTSRTSRIEFQGFRYSTLASWNLTWALILAVSEYRGSRVKGLSTYLCAVLYIVSFKCIWQDF